MFSWNQIMLEAISALSLEAIKGNSSLFSRLEGDAIRPQLPSWVGNKAG